MPAPSLPTSWSRVVLVGVHPCLDGGRWPIRRTRGETVEVVAHVIVDGHDKLAVEMEVQQGDDDAVETRPLALRYNDEYVGHFGVTELGHYRYRVRAWLDAFGTWQDQFRRRVEGGEAEAELKSELVAGGDLLKKAAAQAKGADRKQLQAFAKRFAQGDVEAGLDPAVGALAHTYDPREGAVESDWYRVEVDAELARFAAWYEFFPRSAAEAPARGQAPRHATLDDAAERLPRIKELGFDIVYLPPVHPIGRQFRKGKDNAPAAQPGEPGSPWAIGGDNGDGTLGGHKSVAPELGGLEAFDRFVARAEALGLKVALDIAFQTSPDHPYVKEHPEWFRHRPDGTIRYAENPPKKYQDVYPFDFESADWQGLWRELKSVFAFWIDRGVTVFRVDNPHTKPFAFWAWCLEALRAQRPDLIFLAEAFARPKIMYTLAKLGFNNSYTYFTWRNTKAELTEYAQELFQTEVAEFFRPNFWPNTPDILHDYLVHGGRPAHITRLVLAGTLSSVYGLYGPPFEHVYNKQHPQREEYADNEKYEVRAWNWNDPFSLQPVIARLNRIRRRNPALHHLRNLTLQQVDNDQLFAYSKKAGSNRVLVVVNLDPHHTQAGWVHLDLEALGLSPEAAYDVVDLMGGERYTWHGAHNFVQLNPHLMPVHVFQVQPHGEPRTEADFEFFA